MEKIAMFMKQIGIKAIVVVALLVGMTLMYSGRSGDTSSVDALEAETESEIYSNSEIEDAISVATEYFEENFNGCTLHEIDYIGDERNNDFIDWAERNDMDEVIVLVSSFDVDENGGDGSLNPNSTYENWNWILARSENGNWVHVDHGY